MTYKPGQTLGQILEKKEASPLTSKQICSIIEIASRMGVNSLELGDLRVTFYEPTPTYDTQVRDFRQDFTNSFVRPRKMSEQALEKQNTEQDATEAAFLKHETAKVRETELDQMLVEDPEQYEALVSSGELDERDEND